jgi:hypothetical protein
VFVSLSHLRQTTKHTNEQTLTTANVTGILLGFYEARLLVVRDTVEKFK